MTRAFSKLWAVWLVVLIVLPCSAPFSTCDLPDLLPGEARHGPSEPGAPTKTSASHALPHHVPLAHAAARDRHLPLPRWYEHVVVLGTRIGHALSAASAGPTPVQSRLSAILRV
jgi:hypothetical protein